MRYWKQKNFGMTLIECLLGIAIFMVAFVGIFGVFQLGIRLSGRAKAKVGAVALVNERMEFIRNLPYDDIGTLGGIPSGNLPQTETIVSNGITYTRRTLVQYVDDVKDGSGISDENGITADYKRAKVEITWQADYPITPVYSVTNIVPKGMETMAGGGTLVIEVFNASIQPVASANVHIENSLITPPISLDIFTNAQGKVIFPGTPSSGGYEITVGKEGYSTAKTYDADASNPSPDPAHLTILEGQTTEMAFSIDLLSVKTVRTWKATDIFSWEDLFNDNSKISESLDVAVVGGRIELEWDETEYKSSGYAYSDSVGGISGLQHWNEFSWNDSVPENTNIKYYIYYENEFSNFVLIPNSDLPGNETGFESSPVDLSGLASSTYHNLKFKAVLSTSDTSVTPQALDWQIGWNAGPVALPNIAFHMQGNKTIGRDASNDFIYKYSRDFNSGALGSLGIPNLEYDVYNITADSLAAGYDVSEVCPFQPFSVAPNTSNTTDLYFLPHANNTLLVFAKNAAGAPVEGVSARLYKTGYDQTQNTSSCGQTFFTSLFAATYTIELSKAGYDIASTAVNVAGQTQIEIIMDLSS